MCQGGPDSFSETGATPLVETISRALGLARSGQRLAA
jgi:hypothetical protein